MRAQGVSTRVLIGVVGGVIVRPALWMTALRMWWRMVPRQWWAQAPFLPVPDRRYLAFRVSVVYGEQGTPTAGELLEYLEWCRTRSRSVA